MNLFIKKKLVFLVTVSQFLSIAHADKSALLSDINSTSVISRQIKVGDQLLVSTFFSRPSVGDLSAPGTADYIEIWHGKDQSPYSMINLSGLAQQPANNLRKLMMFGLQQDTFSQPEASRLAGLLPLIKAPYYPLFPARLQFVLGYDVGVGGAYLSACENKASSLILSSGGLFTDEACEPRNLKVLYSLNLGDQVFPFNKSATFIFKKSYSLDSRLDGAATTNKLKDLMQCDSNPITSYQDSTSTLIERYSCARNNDFVVIKHSYPHHQWNGYILVDTNTSNQFGPPNKTPLSRWIYQELDVR